MTPTDSLAAAALAVCLAAPLAGAAACGLGGLARGRLPRRLVSGLAVGAMVLAATAALFACARLASLPAVVRRVVAPLWTLLAVGDLRIEVALALDPLSATMILVVTLVGALIHAYAVGYMAADASPWRFFACLNLFVFFMLLLVLADSLFVLFVGWEGVGLASYLLIGYHHRHAANAAAARKALVTNRVGDAGFLLGMAALLAGLAAAGLPATLSFAELGAALAPGSDGAAALLGVRIAGVPLVLVAGLGLLLGVAGKSAQLPLYTWLPDAMAGPTPVSALIHAATMVTAGVYLVARLSFLFALSIDLSFTVALVGLITALVGALFATFEYNLKRILAYSTVSQLGFMVLALGVGAYGAAIFHLVTHAAFKACLFLAAGSVLHAVEHARGLVAGTPIPTGDESGPHPADPQDVRNLGGLAAALPRTRLAFLLGAVALAGLPIASGFYSKDEILAAVWFRGGFPIAGAALAAVALAVAGLTAFYIFRAYFLVFRGVPAATPDDGDGGADAVALPSSPPAWGGLHESGNAMLAPLLALGGASVVVGPLLGWPSAWRPTASGHHPALEHWLAPVFAPAAGGLGRAAPEPHAAAIYVLQAVGVGLALAGIALAARLYRDRAHGGPILAALAARFAGLQRALVRKLRVDDLYRVLFVCPTEDCASAAAAADRAIDRAVDGGARATATFARSAGDWDRVVVDGAVNGVAALGLASGRRAARLQTGRLSQYTLALAVGVGALALLAWWVAR